MPSFGLTLRVTIPQVTFSLPAFTDTLTVVESGGVIGSEVSETVVSVITSDQPASE